MSGLSARPVRMGTVSSQSVLPGASAPGSGPAPGHSDSDPELVGVGVGRVRAVLSAAAAWYRERLLVDRPRLVVDLLGRRGLVDLSVDTPIGRRWHAGYAPTGPAGTGLVTALGGQGFTVSEMLAAGVAAPTRQDGGGVVVDALRGRLVIPLTEQTGVVGFTARRLLDTNPATPKWVNTATTCVFRKGEHLLGLAQQGDALAAGRGSVVLVEGAVDAIAVNAAGHIGLAAGGTRLTPAHADQLRRATAGRGGRLLLAYDGDPAGHAATNRAADLLPGLPAQVVLLSAGCDPADLLTAHGPRGLRRALAQTRPLLDVALTYRLQRWERHAGNPVALVEAVHEIAPLILSAPPEQRARLVALVAARTGLPAETVTAALLDDATG